MQKKPLDDYLKAASANSKQLQHRVDQLEATRQRSWARWLPSFFVNPSQGRVSRPAPNVDDTSTNLSFSFGWNLGDLAVDPYRINITGMQADLEAVKIGVYNEVTATYYSRLQSIAQYRQLQRALALEPLNAQIRQNKDTVKYNILTLTERLKVYTGMP
jgi:outer membrane protein TolC